MTPEELKEYKLEIDALRSLRDYYESISFSMIASHFSKAADYLESLLNKAITDETNHADTAEETDAPASA